MLQFASLRDYLAAYQADSTLAAVPIPLVAEDLGITPAAVSARVREGRLEGVRIRRNSLVLIRSLLAQKQAREQEARTVEQVLKDHARAGVRSIFYDPVMQPLGLSWRVPADRRRIGEILGDVSHRTHDQHGVLLSVLVHRKAPGTTRPGPGSFNLAEHLGYDWDDEDEFVRQETDKVLAAFA